MTTATMDYLDVPVELKADAGLFVARVSTFGNKDLNGDRMMKGSLVRSVQEWIAKGMNIPVVWSHGHTDPEDFIGEVNPADITFTDDAMIVKGKIKVETSERARNVFQLMKDGLITAWSFAMVVKNESIGKDGVREINDADLFEVGPTLIGANPEAQTIALKALIDQPEPATEIKRGRRISAATAGVLTRMRQELDELLTDGSEDDEEAEAKTASEPTEAEKLRLQLAELEAYLSERGR